MAMSCFGTQSQLVDHSVDLILCQGITEHNNVKCHVVANYWSSC